jgi:hypothetical protein
MGYGRAAAGVLLRPNLLEHRTVTPDVTALQDVDAWSLCVSLDRSLCPPSYSIVWSLSSLFSPFFFDESIAFLYVWV